MAKKKAAKKAAESSTKKTPKKAAKKSAKKSAGISEAKPAETPAEVTAEKLPEMTLYMPLMQNQGGKVPDKSGHGRDGLVRAPDDHDPELFDGQTYIELVTATALGVNDSSFTVSALIKTSDTGDRGIFATTGDQAGENEYLHLMLKSGKPYLGFWANDTRADQQLVADRWYHVTWRYDKTEREQAIFVDGVLDKAGPQHAPLNSSAKLTIGRALADSDTWKGSIQQLRVFPAALSDEQIQQLAHDDTSRLLPEMTLYLPSMQIEDGKVADQSGHGRDGVVRAPDGHEPMLFDGQTWIEVATADELGLNDNSFTVSALVRISTDLTAGDRAVLATTATKSTTSHTLLHLIVRGGLPHLGFYENDTTGTTELHPHRAYHLTWRYDKNQREQAIFIDGILNIADQGHIPLAAADKELCVGKYFNGNYWNGSIQLLRVFPTALDDEQIKQLAVRDANLRLIDLDFQSVVQRGTKQLILNGTTNVGVDGEVRGTPTIGVDPRLGSYLTLRPRKDSHAAKESVEFVGLAEYLREGSALSSFSILLWIRPAPVGTAVETDILSCGDSGMQRWRLWRAGSQIGFEFPTAPAAYQTLRGRLRTDRWTHVAVVHDPTDGVTLYLNGRKVNHIRSGTYWDPLNKGPVVLGGSDLAADVAHLSIDLGAFDFLQFRKRIATQFSGYAELPAVDLSLGELVDADALGKVRDRSGKGHDGLVKGDGGLFEGRAWIEIGSAPDSNAPDSKALDSDADDLSAPDLKLNNSSFTVTAVVNLGRGDGGPILGIDAPGSDNLLMLTVAGGKMRMGSDPDSTVGETQLYPHFWYHLTWRYDIESQEQTVFVNGVQDKCEPGRPPLNVPAKQHVWVGRLAGSPPFQGGIRQLRVFPSALADEHILQLSDDEVRLPWPGDWPTVPDLPEMTLYLPLLKTASAVDNSPRAIDNGHVQGGAQPQLDDVFGRALEFEGAGQSVTLPGIGYVLGPNDILDTSIPVMPPGIGYVGSEGFLVEIWIRPESHDFCSIFSIDDALNQNPWACSLLFGRELTGPLWDGADDASTPFADIGEIAVGRWTHLGLAYEGNELSLYVDGRLQKKQPLTKRLFWPQWSILRVGGTPAPAQGGLLPGPTIAAEQGPVQAVWNASGQRLATVGHDHTVRIWTCGGAPLHTLGVAHGTDSEAGHVDHVTSAAFSPDGTRLATGSQDTTVRLWDVNSGKLLHTFGKPRNTDTEVGHTKAVTTLDFSPDGELLVTAGEDTKAWLWHTGTVRPNTRLRGSANCLTHTDRISSACFSPDGKSILTASYDHTAKIWDLPAAQHILTFDIEIVEDAKLTLAGHQGPIRHAAYSSDGKKIVTCSDDKTARVWDAAGGELQHVLEGHAGGVAQAFFIPSDAGVLTTSQDGTVRHYNLSGKSSATAPIHHDSTHNFGLNAPVLSAQSIDGGQRVLAASADKVVVADPNTFAEVHELTVSGTITGASSCPDGRKIAVTCDDGTVKLWYRPAAFKGRMANLRVFDSAPTPETILQRIDRDILKTATGTIFPLEFSLHNSQHQNVIYIGDLPKTLTLEVTNTGRKNISLAEAGSSGHFELHFRPGTLKEPEKVTLAAQEANEAGPAANWDLNYDADRAKRDGTQVFQLTRRSDGGPAASHTLVAGGVLRLHLGGILADERDGARGTRVQLRYSLQYDDHSPVEGSRLHYLSVLQMSESEMHDNVNNLLADMDAKKKEVDSLTIQQAAIRTQADDATTKLDGFTGTVKELADKVKSLQQLDEEQIAKLQKMLDVEEHQISDTQASIKTLQQEISLLSPHLVAHTDGPAIVITGDSPNTIKIMVVNRSDQPLAMMDESSGTPSKLTFDLHPDKPWGLCTKDDLHPLHHAVSDTAWVQSFDEVKGRLELKYNGTRRNCQPKETLVELTLSDLQSRQPPGEAYVTIEFENVGGPEGHGSLFLSLRRSAVAPQRQSRGKNLTVVDGEVDFVNSPRLGFRKPHWPADANPPKANIALEGDDNLKIDAVGKVTLQASDTVDVNRLHLTGEATGGSQNFTGLKEVAAQNITTVTGVSYSSSPGYLVPRGAIIMWSGRPDHPPPGWVLCNGQHGTPDLRDRFIVGAGGGYGHGDRGGHDTVSLQKSQMPNHDHSASISDPGHHHATDIWLRRSNTDIDDDSFPVYARNHSSQAYTHSTTSNVKLHHVSEGSGQAHENRPPYYALCFIMKT